MQHQITPKNISSLPSIPPAQLWIGDHEILLLEVVIYLQKQFCAHNGCATCTTCRKIADRQHHAILWLTPDNRYTVEQLEPLFSTISFALNPGENYFFILERIDFLSPICANSLLKSLEEPPPGYHFLLLAQREETILPTIRSRCTVQTFFTTATSDAHPLLSFFTTSTPPDPAAFLQELQSNTINDHESLELLDILLKYWCSECTKAIEKKNEKVQRKALHCIEIIEQALMLPPMPGSSALFWKNLFLHIHNAQPTKD